MKPTDRHSLSGLKWLALSIFPLLAACGGGSDDDDDGTLAGRFVDSAVIGISYATDSRSGLTDANGRFRYLPGESVTFSIGGIEIGSTTGAALVTPIDLVPGATDASHFQVVNIIRFIQSLDQDADPDNGITISAAVRNAARGQTLNFASADTVLYEVNAANLLSTLTSGAVTTLISAADAIAHLEATLASTGGFGTLSIAGTDSGAIGGSFSPIVFTEVGNNEFGVVNIQQGASLLQISVTDGEPTDVSFTYADVNDFPNVYSYILDCFVDDCDTVSADLAANTASLANLSIPNNPASVIGQLTNLSSAPVTINGDLSWSSD